METEILKSILKEARETGMLVARIDERVKTLVERADKHDEVDADHSARLGLLEQPVKYRKWLFGVVIGVGAVAGVAEAISRLI
jgi:hypothetical protein